MVLACVSVTEEKSEGRKTYKQAAAEYNIHLIRNGANLSDNGVQRNSDMFSLP